MLRGTSLLFSKTKIILFLFVLSSFFMGNSVFAEGDGTGGGQGEPLTLVSSSVANGATGVSIKPAIKLTFSKNIVNMSVRENNLKCFSLQTAAGTLVPIDVTLADDQTPEGFETRDDAVITPKANLEQGTAYSVVISSALQSKSGVTTGTEIRVTFTTAGVKPALNNNVAVAATPQPQTSTPTAPTNNTAVVTNKVTDSPSTAQQPTDSQTKPADVNTSVQQQTNTTKDNKATVSAAKAEKPKSAKEIKALKRPDKSQADHSIGVYVLFMVVILIAILVYFYVIKKKRIIVKK